MSRRFLTDNKFGFVIADRPLGRGKHNGAQIGRGIKGYQNLVRLSARMAMAEQGFKLTAEPVFVVIVVYVGAGRRKDYTTKELVKRDELPVRNPTLCRIGNAICKALVGVCYEKEQQICGMSVVKRYGEEQRVEVFLGTANTFKELRYDIRNA